MLGKRKEYFSKALEENDREESQSYQWEKANPQRLALNTRNTIQQKSIINHEQEAIEIEDLWPIASRVAIDHIFWSSAVA